MGVGKRFKNLTAVAGLEPAPYTMSDYRVLCCPVVFRAYRTEIFKMV